MLEVSNTTKSAIRDHVLGDLSPPLATVNAKLAAALALGGAGSLAVFPQGGLALTEAGARLAPLVAAQGWALGAALSGVAFAVLPLAILRLACSGLQFRALAQRRPFSLLGWLAVAAVVLGLCAGELPEAGPALVWLASAALTFYTLAALVDRFSFSLDRYLDQAR